MRHLARGGFAHRKATAVVGVVLGFLAIGSLEVYFRAVEVSNYFAAHDALVGWRQLPYQKMTDQRRGFPIRINRHGLRGADFELPKPANERRILCLGDSYMFGVGLEESDTFPVQLQRLVSRLDDAKVFHRVINAGEPGFNTHQELEYLKHYGVAFSPDSVVVGFVLNDFEETTWSARPTLHQVLLAHSALYRRVREKVMQMYAPANGDLPQARTRKRSGPLSQVAPAAIARPLDSDARNAWLKTLGYLEDLTRLCSAHRWDLVIAILPTVLQTDPPRSPINVIRDHQAQDLLLKFCAEHGITCVDLLPVYRQSSKPVWQEDDISHPDATGMRLAAEETFSSFQSQRPHPAETLHPGAGSAAR